MTVLVSSQGDLLALIAEDRTHESERRAVLDAIRQAVREHGNVISSNEIRPHVPSWVYCKVRGAVTSSLIAAKVLTQYGHPVRSDDTAGRNSGRWIPQYLVDVVALEKTQ